MEQTTNTLRLAAQARFGVNAWGIDGEFQRRFETLPELTQYVRDRWQGVEYMHGPREFHTDYVNYTLVGTTLYHLGQHGGARDTDAYWDWQWNPHIRLVDDSPLIGGGCGLWLTVTADHIFNGRPRNCRFCPIALSLRDTLKPILGGSPVVEVGNSRAHLLSRAAVWRFELPIEATKFIDDVDQGGETAAPFTFLAHIQQSTYDWLLGGAQ